jgi:hypothetical protein
VVGEWVGCGLWMGVGRSYRGEIEKCRREETYGILSPAIVSRCELWYKRRVVLSVCLKVSR